MKQLNRQKLETALETRMEADRADGRVGGTGLAVMQHGEIVCRHYFGTLSAGGTAPVTDRTIFRLASMTKPITTVAALMQVEAGLIDLDEPISRLLPAFGEMSLGRLDENGHIVITGKAAHPLTLRILLNHTNGVGTMELGAAEETAMTSEDYLDLRHSVDYIAQQPLAFEPTTRQFYSPIWAFDVVARLVELTSGLGFDAFLKTRLFDPCGMSDTTFAPTDEQWARMIAMHNRAESDGRGHSIDARFPARSVFPHSNGTWFSGGAGLAATLPDYLRFAEMLRRNGVARRRTPDGQVIEERILSEASVRAMRTPTVSESVMPGPQKWGLGVRVICGKHWMPEHCFGWSGAYGSHFWVDPANDLVAVYMKNSLYDGGSGAATAAHFEQDVYASFD